MRLLRTIAMLCAFAAAMAPAPLAAAAPSDQVRDMAPEKFAQSADAAKAVMMSAPEIALDHAQQAAQQSQLIPGPLDRRIAYLTSLWLQAEALTRLNRGHEARPIIERALQGVTNAAPKSKLHGDILKSRAAILSNSGSVNQALADLHEAHNIFRALGEVRSQAIVLQNLGMIYFDARDYERVLSYYEQASAVDANDPALKLASLNNRGNALKEMGDYVEAEKAYRKAFAVAKSLDSPLMEARILTNIASAQYYRGELDEADETADLALTHGSLATVGWTPFVWGVKAQIAFARGQPERARQLIERLFGGIDLEKTDMLSREFHNAAREIYMALGETELAYRHLEAFKRLEDEAREVATSTNSALMAARFDAANQEVRIAKLQADQIRNDTLLQRSEARVQLITIAGILGGAAALAILVAILFGFFAARRTHREITAANNQLIHAAGHDGLTGLANRTRMRNIIDEAIARTAGNSEKCALFLIDLDRFKEVNDTLGHAAGDQLLRGVAERLRDCVRSTDAVGRLGGDEFAVVVHSIADRERLAELAECMITSVSRPFDLSEGRASVGATVGIAVAPDDGRNVDSLSRSADLALYTAKSGGRGQFQFFEPSMQADADARRAMENDLRDALAKNELSIMYQPIVSAGTSEIVAYEALLRWRHPEHGMIGPDIFVPLAEDAGLINRIGTWVLRTACETATGWDDHIVLAVNLSALQVESDGLASTVLNALSASGLAPHRLELEVTESVFMRHGSKTNAMLERLRAIGVALALDDFGTGYSSLGYLQRAEFSKIKIDRSFVQSAVKGCHESVAIIEAIVALARSLNMETTAEGIETEADREAMVRVGCTQLQGYLFGRPAPHTMLVPAEPGLSGTVYNVA